MSFPKLLTLSLDTADISECIPGTEHSLKSLLDALRDGSPQFFQMELANGPIQRVNAESIDGQGLMSSIFRFSIFLQNDTNFNAIFKITTTQKLEKIKPMEIDALQKTNGPFAMEELRKLLFEMSNLEADFYEMVVPHVPANFHILPRAFAILRSPNKMEIERGFALIEDLAPKGLMPDLYEGLREEQVKSALLNLAKFHAISMAFPPKLIDRFHVQYYGTMNGLEGEILDRVLKLGSPYFHRNRKTLEHFLNVNNSLKKNVHQKFGIRPVLCHGDFWANNLFFERRKEEDNAAGDELCAIIDWQTPHANTGLNDVLRLIFSSVNAEMRQERMWEWVDLYFDTLQEEAGKLSIQQIPKYSAELRRKLYAEQSHFELTFVFLAIPTLFPGAQTEQQRVNLMGRMESLFEERRPEYERLLRENEQKKTMENKKFCHFL